MDRPFRKPTRHYAGAQRTAVSANPFFIDRILEGPDQDEAGTMADITQRVRSVS